MSSRLRAQLTELIAEMELDQVGDTERDSAES